LNLLSPTAPRNTASAASAASRVASGSADQRVLEMKRVVAVRRNGAQNADRLARHLGADAVPGHNKNLQLHRASSRSRLEKNA
jgi:hypothetical protein